MWLYILSFLFLLNLKNALNNFKRTFFRVDQNFFIFYDFYNIFLII